MTTKLPFPSGAKARADFGAYAALKGRSSTVMSNRLLLVVAWNRFLPSLFTNDLAVLSQSATEFVIEVGLVAAHIEGVGPTQLPVRQVHIRFSFSVGGGDFGVRILHFEAKLVLVQPANGVRQAK
ncbi:MAG: hypothetical protein WAJ97_05540 [Terriglobales bacterium]